MRAFIFDLDGTLLDSLTDIANASNNILLEMGLPQHPVEKYKLMIGDGFGNLLRRAIAPFPEPANFQEIVGRARSFYAQHMMEKTVPYPGMTEVLERLAAAGCKLAVLSNKPDVLTCQLISHYFPLIHFARVQGARDSLPLKPDPQTLLAVIGDLGADSAFYVGDSNVDVKTALAAGCHAIGVAWGFRGEQELLDAGAERVISAPQQLLELLNT